MSILQFWQLNSIVSAYDADAQTFFTATGITDASQKDYINTLVLAYKSASIWTKRTGIYCMVGGTAGTHAVNLKSPGTFNLTFVGSPTHSANGVDWNGTTQYATTGIVPNTNLSKDAKSLGYYSRENTAATAACEIGCVGVAGGTFDGMFIRQTGDLFYGYLSDGVGATVANANSQGWYLISRSNTTQVNFYKNGVALGTNPKTLSSGGTQNTGQIEIGRGNGQYSVRQCAFAVVGADLNSTEQLAEYNAIQAFQTSLARQV